MTDEDRKPFPNEPGWPWWKYVLCAIGVLLYWIVIFRAG
jgi:uncharacterized membrane-anchored protein